MIDVQVIDEPAAAAAVLDRTRARVLAALAEPGSATTVAAALGLPRQQVNYHLRILEAHGLVELVEERPRRGLTERVVQATARGLVLSPAVLGVLGAEPSAGDRLSSQYLLALAARAIREVGDLAQRASAVGKPLATLAIDAEIRFATAADRESFTNELAAAIAALAAKYHDETSPNGRRHRLVALSHPTPPDTRTSPDRRSHP